MQTEDMLRTMHMRPKARPDALDQTERHAELMAVLGRIADALETQVTDQHDQAAFSRLLLRGISPDDAAESRFDDYRIGADDLLEVLIDGEWRLASTVEEQEIADMNQKRRQKRR